MSTLQTTDELCTQDTPQAGGLTAGLESLGAPTVRQ